MSLVKIGIPLVADCRVHGMVPRTPRDARCRPYHADVGRTIAYALLRRVPTAALPVRSSPHGWRHGPTPAENRSCSVHGAARAARRHVRTTCRLWHLAVTSCSVILCCAPSAADVASTREHTALRPDFVGARLALLLALLFSSVAGYRQHFHAISDLKFCHDCLAPTPPFAGDRAGGGFNRVLWRAAWEKRLRYRTGSHASPLARGLWRRSSACDGLGDRGDDDGRWNRRPIAAARRDECPAAGARDGAASLVCHT